MAEDVERAADRVRVRARDATVEVTALAPGRTHVDLDELALYGLPGAGLVLADGEEVASRRGEDGALMVALPESPAPTVVVVEPVRA